MNQRPPKEDDDMQWESEKGISVIKRLTYTYKPKRRHR